MTIAASAKAIAAATAAGDNGSRELFEKILLDEEHHVDKRGFKVPFVCGARNLGEALRRIAEGAAMIRTKGEAGSGNVVEAVRHMRAIQKEMKQLTVLGKEELVAESKKLQAPLELVEYVAGLGVLAWGVGGIEAEAALLGQPGHRGALVATGIPIRALPVGPDRALVERMRGIAVYVAHLAVAQMHAYAAAARAHVACGVAYLQVRARRGSNGVV